MTNSVKQGRVKPTEAEYHPTIPAYQGNPLIEALRLEPQRKELRSALSCRMTYNPDKDPLDTDQNRRVMVEALRFFFEPLPRHVDLVNGVFAMMRRGYVPRNPSWGVSNAGLQEDALESAGLFGPSGTGKTKSVRRILNLMPQVIHHSNYHGTVVDETQVTWLCIECPSTPRALCSAILQKTDRLLGTDYESAYGGTRGTTSTMIPGVNTLVQNHHLGLLVIDEIQNLFISRTRSSEEVESFIVQIVNDWGVPVLMVGTTENFEFVSQNFRIRRRLSGLSQPQWGRLDPLDPEWQCFTNALFHYRYVKKPLDADRLRPVLFDLTQGIPDLAAKLFSFAQLYAINERIEEVTPEVLSLVMKRSLSQNESYLRQLRNGLRPDRDYAAPEWNQIQLVGITPPAKPAQPRKSRPNPDKQIPVDLFGKDVSTHEALKNAGMVFEDGMG